MRISFLLIFLIIKNLYTFGHEITGVIKDSISNEPIEFAAVYINGTTIGTTSDLNGRFNLSFEMENCRIVINHVSYQSVHINFNQNTKPYLNIKLKPKNIHIRQVTVESVNKRKKNME